MKQDKSNQKKTPTKQLLLSLAEEADRTLFGLNSRTAAVFQCFLACPEAKPTVMAAMKLCMHML